MTAVLLVGSWLALYPRRWRAGLLFAVVAVMVYSAVRLAVGDAPNHYAPASVWALNTTPQWLFSAAIYIVPLLFLVAAALYHWRGADVSLRRLVMVVCCVYLPAWAVFGIWRETRLLMPLLILVLPMVTQESSDGTR